MLSSGWSAADCAMFCAAGKLLQCMACWFMRAATRSLAGISQPCSSRIWTQAWTPDQCPLVRMRTADASAAVLETPSCTHLTSAAGLPPSAGLSAGSSSMLTDCMAALTLKLAS
jgi:hypothetical protein